LRIIPPLVSGDRDATPAKLLNAFKEITSQ